MEKLMHYIWEHRLLGERDLVTTTGEKVQIIDPGHLNTDSGPDFFNAKIRIGNKIWAGNVEIHERASDWKRHNHHTDQAYDSVILHVVGVNDMQICRICGEMIPQMVMVCSPRFRDDYAFLVQQNSFLPCGDRLGELSPLVIADWISALSLERLQQKSDRIFDWLKIYKGSWQEVCYVTLSRSIGLGTNNDAFERLARGLPLIFLQKHAASLIQLEAFLFGQAGLLEEYDLQDDSYYRRLSDEYLFLKNKFGLHPMKSESWKFFRLRPANFPHQRIAMLARFISDGFSLFSGICDATEEKEYRQLFDIRLDSYWNTHYAFGRVSSDHPKTLGRTAVDILLINTVAPLLYAYGMFTGDNVLIDRSMTLLESLKSEQNRIVREFSSAGVKCNNALESQALIQLHNAYCVPRKCLYCRIGHKLLACKALK